MLHYEESDDIRMIRESVRKFAADNITREKAAEWDKKNHFPEEVYDALAELGVMGLTTAEEYGGAGINITATMAVIEELSKCSLAVAVPYIMCTCYAAMNVGHAASEEQKKELLPEIAAGRIRFSYGWTEPDVGGDVASVKSTGVRDGDEVVINGAKRFCSGAAISHYIYAVVRTGPEEERHKNLSIVLIPPTTPGVLIEPIDAMGMKGAPTTDVTLTDVRVPAKNIIGGEAGWNNGWAYITGSGLNVEKLELSAIALGLAQVATEDAWKYVQERKQFGKRILEYQSIRHKLAEMQTELHACRVMLNYATDLADRGKPCGVETSMTKMYISEAAKKITLEAQTIMGAYGYVKEFPTERYVRDALLIPIGGGSTAIQKNNIVNWMGLPRQ